MDGSDQVLNCISEDIARGIDELLVRQPIGVVAAVPPLISRG
jgi:hypothetical protein